ncbi:MAG: phage head morphogenesis protein, partial [Streptococcaceae bacterium]|nr:phage head morphogenesis protein [Streptococcaceae bacterium]
MMAKSIDYEREIARIYNQQLRSIETQIEAFYQRYATKNKIDLSTVKLQAKKTDVEALADTARILVANKDFS